MPSRHVYMYFLIPLRESPLGRIREERKQIASLCKSLKLPILKCIGSVASAALVSHAYTRVYTLAGRSTRVSVRRVSGHLHAKRGRRGATKREARHGDEGERGKGKKRARQSRGCVRTAGSCTNLYILRAYRAPEQYAACEVAVTFFFFPGTTLQPCTYSWLHRFANWWPFVCALHCERPVGKPQTIST